MDWTTVLTSAAVGAVVGHIAQLLRESLERRHRKKELVFRFAVEEARRRRQDVYEVAKLSAQAGKPVKVQDRDPIRYAAEIYPTVEHLFDHGRLPPDAPPERLMQ